MNNGKAVGWQVLSKLAALWRSEAPSPTSPQCSSQDSYSGAAALDSRYVRTRHPPPALYQAPIAIAG